MTGNTKGLDEILNAVTNFTYDAMAHPGDPLVGTLPTMDKATAKLAILDWNNKQMSELLDRLAIEVRASDYIGIAETIQSERNKLTMANSPQLDKLKESK